MIPAVKSSKLKHVGFIVPSRISVSTIFGIGQSRESIAVNHRLWVLNAFTLNADGKHKHFSVGIPRANESH
jgi:hypothetical protein